MNKPTEFRTIPGFSDYEISSDGEIIRRIKGGKPGARVGHVMKQTLTPYGYKAVGLVNDDGKKKNLFVHRLVAAAFMGDPADKQINHKDGNKTNNAVENLELVTSKENVAHAIHVLGNSRTGERNGFAKLKESDIPAILDRRGRGESQRAIARDYGVTQQTISYICTGRQWKHAVASPVLGIRAKLKESDIPAILDRRSQGETLASIAADYGVTQATIYRICSGKLWKHVSAQKKDIC